MAIKAKKVKRSSRDRTKLRIRKKISGTAERPRISIFRSAKHTYAQVIADESGATLVSASTLEKEVIDQIAAVVAESESAGKAQSTKSVAAAAAVGRVLAQRCKDKNINKVVFDRNGFVYKGRVKALADGARKAGLEF